MRQSRYKIWTPHRRDHTRACLENAHMFFPQSGQPGAYLYRGNFSCVTCQNGIGAHLIAQKQRGDDDVEVFNGDAPAFFIYIF